MGLGVALFGQTYGIKTVVGRMPSQYPLSGPASQAMVLSPEGVLAAPDGSVYVADALGRRVIRVMPDGSFTTVAGNGINTAGWYSAAPNAKGLSAPSDYSVAGDNGKAAATLIGACTLSIANPAVFTSAKHGLKAGDVVTIRTTGWLPSSIVPGRSYYVSSRGLTADAFRIVTDPTQTSDVRSDNPTVATQSGTHSLFLGGSNLSNPSALAMDQAGNLYIADRDNHVIRKVDTNGIITTFAGSGVGAYGGDGRSVSLALINAPRGMDFGPDGNLYIADTGNHRIRKVDVNSMTMTTVVGRGTSGSAGDGTDDLISLAQLNAPEDVKFGPDGGMYIADTGNHRIRKVKFGSITTFAGTGTAGNTGEGRDAASGNISNPAGLAFAANGDLYFTDRGTTSQNSRIRFVVGATHVLLSRYQYAAQADTTNNSQGQPCRISIGSNGNIYWADTTMRTVMAIDSQSTNVANVKTIVGRGNAGAESSATDARLITVGGVAVDPSGNLFVSDQSRNQVYKVDAKSGTMSAFAGTGQKGAVPANNANANAAPTPALAARFSGPTHMATDAQGNLYICDTNNNRILKADATSGNIAIVAGGGSSTADGVAAYMPPNVSGSGICPVGTSGCTAVPNQPYASLNAPKGVAVDASGNIYIVDSGNHQIRMVDTNGIITTIAGQRGTSGSGGDGGPASQSTLNAPQGITVDANGNIYFCDTGNTTVRLISNGYIFTVAGRPGGNSYDAGSATQPMWERRMRAVQSIGVDAKGLVYIDDTDNNTIRRFDPNTGIGIQISGSGANSGNMHDYYDLPIATALANNPSYANGLAVDQNSGTVYIGQRYSSVVRALVPNQ